MAIAGYATYVSQDSGFISDLTLANVEALADSSESDKQLTFYCCGNTGTCAKGTDVDTNEEFVIHGNLRNKPC